MGALKSATIPDTDNEVYLGQRFYLIDGYGKHLRKVSYLGEYVFEWGAGWANLTQLELNPDVKSKVQYILDIWKDDNR